jgi:hypothetical protein
MAQSFFLSINDGLHCHSGGPCSLRTFALKKWFMTH